MCGYTKRLSDGISGRLFEETTLGKCNAIAGEYKPRREAMAEVRSTQPAQKTRVARELETELTRLLGSRVLFYTAVRSALDEFHKIDGWFEFGVEQVTVDVTINGSKHSGKADLILHEDDFENLSELARRIAAFFRPQQRSTRHDIRVWRAA